MERLPGTQISPIRLQSEEKLEARGGIEPPIKVLQTFALPLGDRASMQKLFSFDLNPAPSAPCGSRCRAEA
jgi:hypothetical protein